MKQIKNKKSSQFDKFHKECLHQIESLGLKHWDITINHDPPEEEYIECLATCDIDNPKKTAVINFNKNLQHADPERTAKHEMAHLLLAELQALALDRFANENQINGRVEELCIILEKIL
jgi:hypothetical protein